MAKCTTWNGKKLNITWATKKEKEKNQEKIVKTENKMQTLFTIYLQFYKNYI